MNLNNMGEKARAAFARMSAADGETRAAAVRLIADRLQACRDEIRSANEADIARGRQDGLSEALIDRLTLSPARLDGIIDAVRQLADMADMVGTRADERTLPNGLRVHRRRVPLGVLGVIYESRPNVTVDIASLCVKTGNAAILRGGKETLHSNRLLVACIHEALDQAGLPTETIQFIDSPDREYVARLLRLNRYVDVIVPRGGNALHEFCREHANIPVITGGIGVCHLFVDASADLDAALPLVHNAKTQRPSVCNSLDTLLVHESVADAFLPRLVEHLAPAGVSFRAEARAAALLDHPAVHPAGAEDFDTEWLALVLGLKVVSGLEEAVEHIARHSTHHSDGILSADAGNIARFVRLVDSAGVFVNASTRFNDGGQLGLGAEVAVSTQRLHARGPMGLPELTTYKWVVEGEYTVRD